MESRAIKIPAPSNNKISLKVIPGHFATNHSHINYFIDLTTMKSRANEAREVAKTLVMKYVNNTVVDTIVCMDGCEVIGAYIADELTASGFMSRNEHKTVYVVSPEFNTNGQMIFRDNIQSTIAGKNIVLLLASATTGQTINKALECIKYYGGIVQGISAIFSAVPSVNNIAVDTVFRAKDVPGYETYPMQECPFCKKDMKIEAIVNSYGYSKL